MHSERQRCGVRIGHPRPFGRVAEAAFSPDGSVLASSSSDRQGLGKGRTVILSDVSSSKTRAVLPHPDSVSALARAEAARARMAEYDAQISRYHASLDGGGIPP